MPAHSGGRGCRSNRVSRRWITESAYPRANRAARPDPAWLDGLRDAVVGEVEAARPAPVLAREAGPVVDVPPCLVHVPVRAAGLPHGVLEPVPELVAPAPLDVGTEVEICGAVS